MAQLININSTEFRRCNLSAIQSGGTWASIVPDENEIILISTTNSLTADGSGNCDAYVVGDGTKTATALELKYLADEHPAEDGKNSASSSGVYEVINKKLGYVQQITSAHNGYSLSNVGALTTNSWVQTRGVSDYFSVKAGGALYIKSGVFQGGSNNYAAVAFYTEESESSFVSCINAQPYSTELIDKTINVPATANFARVVLKDFSEPAIIGKQDKTIKEAIDEVDARIDEIEEEIGQTTELDDVVTALSEKAVKNRAIKSYVDSVTGLPIDYLTSAHDGSSLDENGAIVTNSFVTTRGVTDFIPVVGGTLIYIKSGVFQGGTLHYSAIAFYSSADEASFVSRIIGPAYGTEVTDREYSVPSAANFARFVLKDFSVPAITGAGSAKTIAQLIKESSGIAKNYGKSIVIFGGSHTAKENSEIAKNIWRRELGLSVFTAGVGSAGIVSGVNMGAWTYNGVSYYTRIDFADAVGTRVWDDVGYLSELTITAKGSTTITLSDGNTYTRDTSLDYYANAQTKVARLVSKSQLNKDIYLVWLSTNDYTGNRPIGAYTDYTAVDSYDVTKTWRSESQRGTVCGGFNNILKTIRENNPTAEIYVFTSFRYFSAGARGYDPYTDDGVNGLNFYQYQQEVLKAAQVGGCAILDQFMLQGVDVFNYSTFYESDNLHLKESGYLRIGYIQAEFLANGK